MQRVTFERLLAVCSCVAAVLSVLQCAPATALSWTGACALLAAPPARTSHHTAGSRLGRTDTPAFKSARALAHIDTSSRSMYSVLSHEEMIKPKEPPQMFARCACYLQCQGQGSVTGG